MKQAIIVIFITISLNVFAQNPNDEIIVMNGNGGIRTMNFKNKSKSIEGSYYYSEEWNAGTIKLFSGETIENYPLKYDLKLNQIDIKADNSVKVLSIGAIKEVIWTRKDGTIETFRNSSQYTNNNSIGFFLFLTEGKISLLKKTELNVIESNYNPAMDVGSQSKKYVKKDKYYILIGDEITLIKKSKKKILKIFNDNADIVKKYAEENELDFKNDYDLSKIFNYYNNL